MMLNLQNLQHLNKAQTIFQLFQLNLTQHNFNININININDQRLISLYSLDQLSQVNLIQEFKKAVKSIKQMSHISCHGQRQRQGEGQAQVYVAASSYPYPQTQVKNQHQSLISILKLKKSQNQTIRCQNISTKQTKGKSAQNFSSSLESQLSHLSKTYSMVQTKLLQTQKMLYNQTLLSEKQRSIIELLKYILSANNQQNFQEDYSSILNFISKLEIQNNSSEGKNIVKIELDDIKRIIQQNKIKRMRQGRQVDQIRQLKLQINKMMQHSLTLQQTFCEVNDDNYQLKQTLAQKQKLIGHFKQLLEKEQNNVVKLTQNLEKLQKDSLKSQQKMIKSNNFSEGQKARLQDYEKVLKQISQLINKFIPKQSKQQNNSPLQQKQNNICSSSKALKSEELNKTSQIVPKLLQSLKKILNKSLSNKEELKRLKKQLKNQDFQQKQIRLLKQFVSDQVLLIFRQYELTQGKEECLEQQIKNYSKLQRRKIYKLEQCQLEIWRLRNKLLKKQNCQTKDQVNRISNLDSAEHQLYTGCTQKQYPKTQQNTRIKFNLSTQLKELIQIQDFKLEQQEFAFQTI